MNPQINESVSDKIKKLKELLDMGALSQQEFDDKKRELLKQL
ncbi:MAG: SHOCT domain-containing protein [Bacteroidota bacterium]